MISKILFIDDDYLYGAYPLPKKLDRDVLISIIDMEQFSSIQDLLGEALYADIETKVSAQSLNATEEGLFKLIQYSLAMYSARAAATLLRSAIGRTKNEEQGLNSFSLDGIINAVDSKISYINQKIIDYILGDATLKAKAEEADKDKFNPSDNYNSSVFYPVDNISDDCD